MWSAAPDGAQRLEDLPEVAVAQLGPSVVIATITGRGAPRLVMPWLVSMMPSSR